MDSFFILAAVATTIAGICSHVFYFRTGEHHMWPQRFIQSGVITAVALTLVDTYFFRNFWLFAFYRGFGLVGIFIAGAVGSALVHRIYLSPLNKFPGPFSCRISKNWLAITIGIKYDGYKRLQRLHQKYGKIVRIGPNDLSIIDPDGTEAFLGESSRCGLAPWYEVDAPLISVHTTRNDSEHARRREVWNGAFTPEAMQTHEAKISRLVDQLMNQILEHVNKVEPMNASIWFTFFSFDVMAACGYTGNTGRVQAGTGDDALVYLSEGLDSLGSMYSPWYARFMLSVPVNASSEAFTKYTQKLLAQRGDKMDAVKKPDILMPLFDVFKTSNDAQADLVKLQADARLIFTMGTETVASTLSFLCYYLAKDRTMMQNLRKELDPRIGKESQIPHENIKDAPYLNAVINEVLRLHPPIPSGLPRRTPPEGVKMGETYIPGETTVQMPLYAMARDEDSYADCESFIPERWISKRNLVKRRDAYAPFSVGPRNCAGQDLALMEIRLLTARLVTLFDISLAAAENGQKLLEKSVDHFTLGPGDLYITFAVRKKR